MITDLSVPDLKLAPSQPASQQRVLEPKKPDPSELPIFQPLTLVARGPPVERALFMVAATARGVEFSVLDDDDDG